MRKLFLLLISSTITIVSFSQKNIVIKCIDSITKKAVEKASVYIDKKSAATTNSKGVASLFIGNATPKITISSIGYETKIVEINTAVTHNSIIEIKLFATEKNLEDVVVIASTRNNQGMEKSPIKVEVLGKEEMQEESTIKPGNIASILGDVSGVQIQQSSATSGNANVRIQGLDGRYTQILKDGMPLYDGFSGGFGVLSIPPLDLKQIELIKGSASTLYGGGAIGGLINIISKKPLSTPEHTFILNHTTLKETNFNAFLSKKYNKLGYTLFAGYTQQHQVDVNDDGFSDLPLIKSFVAHPRLFFYLSKNTTLTLGYTGTIEKRKGGDMFVLDNKIDSTHQFFEENKLNRHSFEFVIEQHLSKGKKLEFKTNISSFNRAIETNTISFKGNQNNYFSEATLFIPDKKNSTVIGINFLGDRFNKTFDTNNIALRSFSNTTFGVFAQHTLHIQDNTTIDFGLRNDYHTTYGNKILPRVALFHKFNQHWATRAGIGFGYKTPNVLSTQNTDYKIENIQPLSSNITAEKSIGYNAEVNYKKVWDNENQIFINLAFFMTKINYPIIATENMGNIYFMNATNAIVSKGFDIYVQGKIDDWEVYLGYTFTSALRKYLSQNEFMPLTPKNRMAFTLVKEFEPNWRIGLEGSLNGSQFRNDGTSTPSYFFGAAMVERKFGNHVSLVLNGENLFDYRQSKVESLFTGTITNPTFQSLWAPIDGRVFNLSVRIK